MTMVNSGLKGLKRLNHCECIAAFRNEKIYYIFLSIMMDQPSSGHVSRDGVYYCLKIGGTGARC